MSFYTGSWSNKPTEYGFPVNIPTITLNPLNADSEEGPVSIQPSSIGYMATSPIVQFARPRQLPNVTIADANDTYFAQMDPSDITETFTYEQNTGYGDAIDFKLTETPPVSTATIKSPKAISDSASTSIGGWAAFEPESGSYHNGIFTPVVECKVTTGYGSYTVVFPIYMLLYSVGATRTGIPTDSISGTNLYYTYKLSVAPFLIPYRAYNFTTYGVSKTFKALAVIDNYITTPTIPTFVTVDAYYYNIIPHYVLASSETVFSSFPNYPIETLKKQEDKDREKIEEEFDPYNPGGTSGTGGGDGSYDDTSDGAIEQESSYSSSSLGLYTTYACDASTIASIGSALYADNFLEALNLGLLKVLFNSPIDALIQLMAFPFDVPASYSGNVKFGSIELKVSNEGQSRAISAPIVSNSNLYIDWGTVNIQEYWGTFLDYSPQTKIDLHLPWGAGHVQIDPAEVMNHGIRVTSLIDITKGQCVHAVYGRTNIGTFSCQCGQQLPITALDTSGKALGIATSAIAIAATAGFSGAAQSAGIAAANSASAPLGASIAERAAIQREAIARAEAPYRARQRNAGRVAVASAVAAARVPVQFPRNGSFGMGSAHLDIQKPYVVISRPIQNYPRAYGNHYGYPCNMYLPLGSLSGYTEIGEVHLDGISCTSEEKDEIDKLLKGGIIL